MIPIETATSRDILAATSSSHAMHSMDGATVAGTSIGMSCSCGSQVTLSSEDCDLLGWKLGDVATRLRKLCQTGRGKS